MIVSFNLSFQGQPFPDQEREAIDVVMKYAVTKLGFEVENIILFAWSIGGYTASYGAMMYPNVKAVVSCDFSGIDKVFSKCNVLNVSFPKDQKC